LAFKKAEFFLKMYDLTQHFYSIEKISSN